MNQRIDTVRQYAPNSLVMVYQQGLQQIQAGQFPMYTQKNLLFDAHIYSSHWTPANTSSLVSYIHAHSDAFIISEWGGKPGKPDPNIMIPFLKSSDVEACYFATADLVAGSAATPTALNSIGQAVASGYSTIIGS